MKVRRVGVESHVLHDLKSVSGLTREEVFFRIPEEVVQEILLHVTPDEPAHLVRASLVYKSWHSILFDHSFRHRYRRFHGPPPLLGYICNQHIDSTVRFVPTTTIAATSIVADPKLDNSNDRQPSAMDCRHGRVLIETKEMLIVWDLISGSQQDLSMPTNSQYSYAPYRYNYAGSVLCAVDGCDHLDCHGGSFRIVLVGMSYGYDHREEDGQTRARVYSLEAGVWSSPTTPSNDKKDQYIDDTRSGIHIGDALYYITMCGEYNIVKYHLCKHDLSVMHLPIESQSILIKGNDGGLEVVAMSNNCISMWSWQVGNKDIGGWVKYREMELENTLILEGDNKTELLCMAEGTNTIFIGVDHTGVFTLDLRSCQVRKIGDAETYHYRPTYLT